MPMIVMGHVIGSSGVHGWIKVFSGTDKINGLLGYSAWWFRINNDDWREIEVASGRISGNVLVIKLKGCSDRDEAARLKGMQIAIPRDRFPDLPKNGEHGYYWADLIGATVVNLQSETLGTVSGLFETGANDVLQVQNPALREKLIPFIDQVIIKVDLNAHQLTVDWGIDY